MTEETDVMSFFFAAQVCQGKRKEIEEKGGNDSTMLAGIASITVDLALEKRHIWINIPIFVSELDKESG